MRNSPLCPTAKEELEERRKLAADLLALFAEEVKIMCESGGMAPREVLLIGGLMFDAWEQWEALSAGKRSSVAALTQLVDRIARKSKRPMVEHLGRSLTASLAKLAP